MATQRCYEGTLITISNPIFHFQWMGIQLVLKILCCGRYHCVSFVRDFC